jgi:hypothetical protein
LTLTYSSTPSSSPSPTVSPSPTATQTTIVLFHFTLSVYNSAGELVKTLSSNNPSLINPQGDFALSANTFAPQNGQALTVTAGGQSLLWTGNNNNSQLIQNGMYYVTLQSTDQFGHVETTTKQITVLSSALSYTVDIYNSSGEMVDQLAASGYGNNAPSGLGPNRSTIVVGPGAGSSGSVVFNLGNGSSVTWNGTNGQGQQVQSGSYTAQLAVSHDNGAAVTVDTASITVLNTAQGLLSGAVLAPNPASLQGLGKGGGSTLFLNTASGVQVVGRLYNLAGELVLQSTNDMAPNKLQLDLGSHALSSGVYILSVTAQAPWGTVERKNFKMVVIR